MSDEPRIPLHYIRRHDTEPIDHLAIGPHRDRALCGAQADSWTLLGQGTQGPICPVCSQKYWGHEPDWVIQKYKDAVIDRVERLRDVLGDDLREYPLEVQNVVGRFEMLEKIRHE